MPDLIRDTLAECAEVLDELRANESALASIHRAGEVLAEAFRNGNRAYSCGNGGSMCDAMHFAEELSGRFREDRPALGAASISDPSHLSCVANDYGYDHVFSRYVEAHGRPGDVLLGISTSGNSGNVILAVEKAREIGMQTIVLTGRAESRLPGLADVAVVTPGRKYADRVQELHIKVIHILIDTVEQRIFGKTAG